jgi:hypothetical protein
LIFCAVDKPKASSRGVLGKHFCLNASEIDGGKPIGDFSKFLKIEWHGRRIV